MFTCQPFCGDRLHVASVDAIVVISAERYVDSTMADDFLGSLNNFTTLPIYILTDRPSCIDASRYSSGPVHIINVGNVSLHLVSKMNAKSFKTKIFDYVPNHVTNVLYLDRDTRGTSAFKYWNIPSLSDKQYEKCNIIMSTQPLIFRVIYNSGVFIMNRHRSKACYESWGEKILSNQFSKDQFAFNAAVADGICKPCMMPKGTVSYAKGILSVLGINMNSAIIHYTSSSHAPSALIEKGCSQSWKKSKWYYPRFLWSTKCLFNMINHANEFVNLNIQMKVCANNSSTGSSLSTQIDSHIGNPDIKRLQLSNGDKSGLPVVPLTTLSSDLIDAYHLEKKENERLRFQLIRRNESGLMSKATVKGKSLRSV
jgi:hypothetical protein